MAEVKYFTHEGAVDSSAIHQYWWDSETGDFFVEFPSGQVAGYKDVAHTTFDNFVNADSKGRFYATFIKPFFKGQNGDVDLIRRKTEPVNPAISVGKYEVTFVATMTAGVDAVSVEDAVEKLKAMAKQNGVEDLQIKSVTLNFD